jgi:8-oxo-dGTP diphosphatase
LRFKSIHLVNLPEFGQKIPRINYRHRPGAYAIAFDAGRHIAALLTQEGLFLPGGGIDPGETPEAALRREVREECGCDVLLHGKLGENIEYLFAKNQGEYYQIHGFFFLASLSKKIETITEEDHRLVWLTPVEAIEKLSRQSQAWAVQRAVDISES